MSAFRSESIQSFVRGSIHEWEFEPIYKSSTRYSFEENCNLNDAWMKIIIFILFMPLKRMLVFFHAPVDRGTLVLSVNN